MTVTVRRDLVVTRPGAGYSTRLLAGQPVPAELVELVPAKDRVVLDGTPE